MNSEEKKKILKGLTEKQFREDLLIPLLSKMGFIGPTAYHGSSEKGKDIVCIEYDKFKEQRFLAVVAKTGDLTGNVATQSGLQTVINQVQQAFTNPYENLFNMREVFINEVWVMTTGRIVPGAQDAVMGHLRSSNLDKLIRIIGDDRIVQLVDTYFSTYWSSSSETKESVIIQRDRLISFIEGLLAANNVDRVTIDEVKSSILYSNYSPRISKNIEGLHISSVSSYSIELGKIDPEFDDYIVTRSYGITSKIFQEAKKNLTYSFFDIEETINHADKISKLTNPWEFVVQTQNNLSRDYPFHRPFGDASDFMTNIDYMQEGLRDLKYFKAFLKHKDKLDWAKQLAASIPGLLPEIEKIITNGKESDLIIHFSISENRCIAIEYNINSSHICFTLKEKRIDKKGFSRNDDGTLKPQEVMETALFQFRKYLEDLFEYDEDKWLEEYEEG